MGAEEVPLLSPAAGPAPAEVPPPGLLVIFGASGDLTRRLLVPDLRVDLPLVRLKPGEHLLTVSASVAGATVSRELRFTVR